MKRIMFLAIFVTVTALGTTMAGPDYDLPLGGGNPCPCYGCFWYPGHRQIIRTAGNEVREILDAISSSGERQKFAIQWLEFSKQAETQSLEIQRQWVELQRHYLSSQREIEQLRLERLKLQAEIERLQVEKLRLEKENLELRLKLQKEGSKQEKAK
jgi:hypothetical protein